jgi:hypothetical protein
MSNEFARARQQAGAENRTQVLRKREVLAEIRVTWGKFSEQELSDLASAADLVALRAAKYGLAIAVARRDVAILLNGRVF